MNCKNHDGDNMDSASGQRDNNNIAKMYLSRMMSYFLSGLRTWNIIPLTSDYSVAFFENCSKIHGVLGNIKTPQNGSDYHCQMFYMKHVRFKCFEID